MNEEIKEEKYPDVDEPVVQFKMISDRDIYRVVSERNKDLTLIEISGYDLNIGFNMEHLRSLEDINAAGEAIGIMFKEIILDRLLSNKQNP